MNYLSSLIGGFPITVPPLGFLQNVQLPASGLGFIAQAIEAGALNHGALTAPVIEAHSLALNPSRLIAQAADAGSFCPIRSVTGCTPAQISAALNNRWGVCGMAHNAGFTTTEIEDGEED